MRLLLGVYNFVPTQCARLSESFTADLAYERPNTCVNRHVPRQIVVRIETFAALLALEHFAVGISVSTCTACSSCLASTAAAAATAAIATR